MESTNIWLKEPPKFTTFRINILRSFDDSLLKEALRKQAEELGVLEIPKCYYIKPDCLVLEQWKDDVKIENTGNEVVVDALCAAAVLRGAHVFAPGIMGLPSNLKMDEKVDVYGDIEGKCKRGLKIMYTGKKLLVGSGYLKILRQDLYENGAQPNGIGIKLLLPVSRLPVVNETLYPKGDVLLQNLPSIVCGWVVDAKPNEVILDMCAAPGNKTTHLAEMSGNHAKIIAIDKSIQKVEKILENCLAHGVTCVKSFVFDSTKSCKDTERSIDEGPPFSKNSFDKILLDAPCSGLGQRPQLVNKMTPKMLESYKFVQKKLFRTAKDLLKDGGKLIYSTCTTTVEENEGIVAWALDNFPQLELLPAEPLLGGPGLTECGLSDKQRAMVQRFGPNDDPIRTVEPIYKDTIGFFIAKFVKICK